MSQLKATIHEHLLRFMSEKLVAPPRIILSLKQLSTRKVFEGLIMNRQGLLCPPSSPQLLSFCQSFAWMSSDDHKQIQALMIDAIYYLLVGRQTDANTIRALHCMLDFVFSDNLPLFLAPAWFNPMVTGLLQYATLNRIDPILQQIEDLENRCPDLIRPLRPISTLAFISRANYRLRSLPLLKSQPFPRFSFQTVDWHDFTLDSYEFFHSNPTKREKKTIHSKYRSAARDLLEAKILSQVEIDGVTMHLPLLSWDLRNNLHALHVIVNFMKHAMLNGLVQFVHFPVELFYMEAQSILEHYGEILFRRGKHSEPEDRVLLLDLFLRHMIIPLIHLDDPIASYHAYAFYGFKPIKKSRLHRFLSR